MNSSKMDTKAMREVFDKNDTNYDGKIGRYEFGRIIRNHVKEWGLRYGADPDEVFKHIDSDGDGQITFSQYLDGIKEC